MPALARWAEENTVEFATPRKPHLAFDGAYTQAVQHDVFLADCPARTTLELVANRWSVVVLHGLGEGAMRFGELQARIGGISPKSLAETLHRLNENCLVQRVDGPWELTRLGRSLLEPVRALARWAEENTGELLDARDRREAVDGV